MVSFQIKTTVIAHPFLVFLSTYLTRPIKRTECCVLGTPITPEPRYLILSTSHVFTTVDTSFITTTELTHRVLLDILSQPTSKFVKWRFTVLEINFFYYLSCLSVYQSTCLSDCLSFYIPLTGKGCKKLSLKPITITVANLETMTKGSLDAEYKGSVSLTPKGSVFLVC